MRRKRRKVSTKVRQQRAQHERILDRERDTIYTLIFVPKDDVVVSTDEQAKLWRIQLSGNPNRHPDFLKSAIRVFESNLQVQSWNEVAVRYYVKEHYFP